MKTKELYAPEDQGLFERALVRPVKQNHEFNKMLKALTNLMDRLKSLTAQEIMMMLQSGQIKF